MAREAWRAAAPGVTKSWTRLTEQQQLDGPEFEQIPGDGEGQGSLACCSPRGGKELNTA